MFSIFTVKDTLRVPPKLLGSNLDKAILAIAREEYEGIVDEDNGVVVSVTNVKKEGDGKIVQGDGGIFYDSLIDMLIYKPILHEVVEGIVTEITEFGAFVRTGPIEGLIHVSQVMDDFINYDAKNNVFVGKESKMRLEKDHVVTARTVSISLKGSSSNSKVGYTMRQPGLGRAEWAKKEAKKQKKEAKKKETKKTKTKKGEKK